MVIGVIRRAASRWHFGGILRLPQCCFSLSPDEYIFISAGCSLLGQHQALSSRRSDQPSRQPCGQHLRGPHAQGSCLDHERNSCIFCPQTCLPKVCRHLLSTSSSLAPYVSQAKVYIRPLRPRTPGTHIKLSRWPVKASLTEFELQGKQLPHPLSFVKLSPKVQKLSSISSQDPLVLSIRVRTSIM